ncbi:DMT family transporter [Spirosoma linguale]|uniref:Small multidrug resistance protein n=1 Tax=Spirosoma linguale (strain ATCC 33905 / DSM 74 / LMG 10896 / Claus 1) TaxID=504472 RepID=D2QI02_SPILD|nr:small multidrug resistance protein [Spirosoma linguale DSM 74]
MKYLLLLIAIIFEVIGTASLNASQQFTKLTPSLLCLVAYIGAFYFMSLTLRSMPVGTAYALWSGVGIVLTAIIGLFLFKQVPDTAALVGMTLIVAGVLVMNLLSKTTGH